VSKSGGDFNQSQLEDRAMAVIGDVVPTWEKYAKGKQSLVFGVSVAHSKEMAVLYNQAGYPAEHIDGTTADDEREAIIERFRNRDTMILSNCGIFLEGFDCPNIEVVQCVRPTMSLSLHLQILGRGLRPSPGKEYCIIIDHSDNWRSHGLPDEDREWSLDPVSLRPTRYTQECPDCFHVFQPLSHEQAKPIKKELNEKGMVISTHVSICPDCLCEFEWQMGEGVGQGGRVVKDDHGEVVEVSVDVTQEGINLIRELTAKQVATGKKKGWIYYQAMRSPLATKLSLGDWRYLAKVLGYKEGWAYRALQEAQSVQLELPIEQSYF
jgi:hypothetical protein